MYFFLWGYCEHRASRKLQYNADYIAFFMQFSLNTKFAKYLPPKNLKTLFRAKTLLWKIVNSYHVVTFFNKFIRLRCGNVVPISSFSYLLSPNLYWQHIFFPPIKFPNVFVNLHYRLDVRKEASSMQSNSTEDHIWSDLQRNDSNNLEYNSEGLSPSGMAIRVVEFSNGGYKIRKIFA